MKNKLKKLLAVTLSAACMLTAMPLSGFAAESVTIKISNGKFTVTDSDGNTVDTSNANASDKITAADGKNLFYVTVNGEKISSGYGEKSAEGFKEARDDSEKSGNIFYEEFTVPAAPKGHKVSAEITAEKTEDFYKSGEEFSNGYKVNLSYEPVTYKVTFDLNGGKGEIENTEIKYGSEFKLPAAESATKDGFVLNNWNTSADGNGTMYAPGSSVKNLSEKDGEEIKLHAIWIEKTADKEENENDETEAKKYTVEFYLSDSGSYNFIKEYTEGETIVLPETPVKAGFTFAGWILGEENGNQIPLPEKMPAKNLKAYASWKLNEVKISYISDGEVYSSKTASYGSDIALTVPEDPTKEGYTFAGWFDKQGDNVHGYTTVPAEDVEFTAKWLKNGNAVYLVDKKTYEAYEVTEGDKIPVPENPKKFGYKFKGWNPEVPEVMGNEDLTFNAEWEIDKTFVTIAIGGTVIAGGVLAAIGGTITGLSIIGGIIALIGVTSGINKSYTVTYKVDGKVYQTYKVTAGSSIPTPANPTKNGCKFAGWSPEIPEKMPKQNLTFEAKWTELKDDTTTNEKIPSTGSGAAGIAALSALALSAAAALIFIKKKKK